MPVPADRVTAEPAADPDFVVVAFGSDGDVLPMLAVASALRQRGHAVMLLAPEPFGARARKLGLAFRSIIDEAAAQDTLGNPLLWHPHEGIAVLWPAILHAARETMRWLEPLAAQRRSAPPVLVGNTMALGARVAHERFGWPHATLHLSACWWQSATQPPLFRGLGWLRWLQPAARAKVWAWIEGRWLDPIAAPSLNAWRSGFGLAPVRRVFGRWSASPQRVLGLYPDWFAPLPDDAPGRMRLTGFPLPAQDADAPWPDGLQDFLASGRPTVAVMAGSQMQHGERFFATAREAVERAGGQALLLGPGAREAAQACPLAWGADYVPLAELLPRCKAVISHPGIGTIAHALAAGVPQLLTPYAFDHFDNARRAEWLGVARQLAPNASARRMAAALRSLMTDPQVAKACRAAQSRLIPHESVMAECCDELERLRAQPVSAAAASA
jgi:rhamnosyltransferase subunit B